MHTSHALVGIVLVIALPCQVLSSQTLEGQSAPALVQMADATGSGSRTLSIAMSQAPSLGNLLIVCHDSTSMRDAAVSGGGVSNWTLCRTSLPAMGNSAIWAGVVDDLPETSVVVKFGSKADAAVLVSEWSGCGPTLVFSGISANGFAGPATVPNSPNTVTANTNDLVIATVGVHAGSRQTISTPGNGFTELGTTLGAGRSKMAAAYAIPAAAGTVSTQWSLGTNYRWAAAMVVFHVPTVDPPQLVQQVAHSDHNVAGLTMVLPQPTTAGHLLVVCHDSTSGGNSSIQGGGVTNWTLCRSTIPLQDNSEIWAGIVDGVPTATVQITLGGSPNGASAVVSEWSGFDVPPQISGQISIAVDIVSTAGPVPADAGDLVVAVIGSHGGGQTIAAPTGGFIELDRPQSQPSSIMAGCYFVPTTSGLVATSWQLGYRHIWAAAIVVFHRP